MTIRNTERFLLQMAEHWVDGGGDSEGVLWTQHEFYLAVQMVEEERKK